MRELLNEPGVERTFPTPRLVIEMNDAQGQLRPLAQQQEQRNAVRAAADPDRPRA